MTVRQIDDLLKQAASPLQKFILISQLQLLRQQERLRERQGVSSPEALLTILMIGLVILGTFGLGITLAAAASNANVALISVGL
jgi:hypothetical protein